MTPWSQTDNGGIVSAAKAFVEVYVEAGYPGAQSIFDGLDELEGRESFQNIRNEVN